MYYKSVTLMTLMFFSTMWLYKNFHDLFFSGETLLKGNFQSEQTPLYWGEGGDGAAEGQPSPH